MPTSLTPATHETAFARILLCLGALGAAGTAETSRGAEQVSIRVRETAGIRRFDYPVEVRLQLPAPVDAATSFRLLDAGRPLRAQFRPERQADGTDGTSDRWWIDFSLSLEPQGHRDLTVEYGPEVEPVAERSGLRLERSDDAFRIVHGDLLAWTVPASFDRFLSSMTIGTEEQMQGGGAALLVRRGNEEQPLSALAGDTPGLVVRREGPEAIVLAWEGRLSSQDTEAASRVELKFPVSKSWVRVDWEWRDRQGPAPELAVRLPMQLAPPAGSLRTLVDFGAWTWVYAALAAGEEIVLQAPAEAAAWRILKGSAGRMEPFVVGDGRRPLEGWGHVMDETKCLALAVDEFAATTRDAISVAADGTIQIRRAAVEAARESAEASRLRFWLHFVTNPPQASAATSPQAMLAPLAVDVQP